MEDKTSLADTFIAAFKVHTVLSDAVASVSFITETFINVCIQAIVVIASKSLKIVLVVTDLYTTELLLGK